jgi:flagellar hook-length control protein FliK
MEKMSTIPAPVEAMISGPGSFFGSCQVAANNFEVAFQSAMVSNGTNAAQGAVTDARPRGFGVIDFSDLKTFSTFLEEYGENEVLGNLQEILGEEAGKEAFELALLMAQNDEAFKQLSPEDQMEVFRLFKIMDMAETSTNDVKALLEDWVKDVKNIFAELKIEFKQPEELVSELEEDTPLVAIPPKDLKNIKLLAKEMGIKPKDMPKFAALINNLLKNGVMTSKDLKDVVKAVSEEPIPAREFIEGLWALVKNETKDEIENLVNGKIADLIGELVVDTPKEPVSNSTKEPVVDSAKEPVSNSVKEPVVEPAKENVYSSVKEPVVDSVKEPVLSSVKEDVSDTPKELVSNLKKEPVVDSAKEPVSSSAKEPVSSSAKADTFIPLKENAFSLKEKPKESEEDKLVKAFHLLIKRFKSSESLTKDEMEELKVLVEKRFLLKKDKSLEDEELAIGEEEVDDEESEEELDIDEENKISMKDDEEGEENIAPEEVEDLDLLDILSDPKKLKKNKRKGFNPEAQQASQTQPSQQTLQIQPQQMRQTEQVQHQVQPEVRAVWEGEGLKIELVNPKTGEKLQTTYETIPQRMQERINEFEVVRQVIAQAKFITTPTGEQKMTLQLRPEHLGQVDLRITLNHGEMQIHARVESVTAQSALETHIGLLREGLEKHGITLERLEVSIEQRDRQDAYSLAERQEQREQKHSNRRHNRGREQHLAVSVGKNESSDTGRRLGYNTMEYLA